MSRSSIAIYDKMISIVLVTSIGGIAKRSAASDDVDPPRVEVEKRFVNPQAIHNLAFADDGTVLACFCNAPGFPALGHVYLWRISTGERIGGAVSRQALRFTTIPHVRLCRWSDVGLAIQDNVLAPRERTVPLGDYIAKHDMGMLQFAPNDKLVAGVDESEKTVNVWDVDSGKRVSIARLSDSTASGVRSMAFESDNRYLAIGIDAGVDAVGQSRGSIIIVDLRLGKEVIRSEEGYRVFAVQFRSNGDLLCGGGNGQLSIGMVRTRKCPLFDIENTTEVRSGVTALAVGDDVGLITGHWDGQTTIWDTATHKPLIRVGDNGEHTSCIAIHSQSGRIATGDWDATARVWKIKGK